MSATSEIKALLEPIANSADKRINNHEGSPLDIKVCKLFQKLSGIPNMLGFCGSGGYTMPNNHVSRKLNLEDLKVAGECSKNAADKIIHYLELQRNIEKWNDSNPNSPLLERIQHVSDKILRGVSLQDLQEFGYTGQTEHSPVWYALAPIEEILKRPIQDLKELEYNFPICVKQIREAAIRSCWEFIPYLKAGEDLLIGNIPHLSGEQLNQLAKTLPANACALITEGQLRDIQFDKFKGKQLDRMIAGDGSKEETERKLALLSKEQRAEFLKKSTGDNCKNYPESFYQSLPLSKMTKKQIYAFCSKKKSLQAVSPNEIAAGIANIPKSLLSNLSDEQIQALDFSKLSKEQLGALFDISHEERASLVPARYVNDLVNKRNRLVCHLTPEQLRALNVELLDQVTLNKLFPGFYHRNLYPGFVHSTKVWEGEVLHVFESNTKGVDKYCHTNEELEELVKKNRAKCQASADAFTPQQLGKIRHKLHDEVQLYFGFNILKIREPLQLVDHIAQLRKSNQTSSKLDEEVMELDEKLKQLDRFNFKSADCGNHVVPNSYISTSLNLKDLRTAQESCKEAADKMIQLLGLQQSIDKWNQYSPNFPLFKRIRRVSDEILEEVSLFDLQVFGISGNCEDSPVWYALAPKHEILKRPVNDLEKMESHPRVCIKQIREIQRSYPNKLKPYTEVNGDLLIGNIASLSGEQLSQLAEALSANACALLSEDQLREIPLDHIKGDQ